MTNVTFEFDSKEMAMAVDTAARSLDWYVANALEDIPEDNHHRRECAVASVVEWPAISRVLEAHGVSAEEQSDILQLIIYAKHHESTAAWSRGYDSGWDSALEVWGLEK